MKPYSHSVTLNVDRCKGCTNCIKRCPTMAIRVQGGKAKIIKERCIDCGECIRVCPYHAKKAVTDSFEMLEKYKYNIALVAPAFYGQFRKTIKTDAILTALLKLGFDETFDVAIGAQAVTEKTREMMKSGKLPKPAISSACPAVMRLIAVRFPELLKNLVPLRSPMEIAAQAAKKIAVEKTGLKAEEIGVFFISPCAAKVTSVKASLTVDKSAVDGVFSMSDVCLKVADSIGKIDVESEKSEAGSEGILWATSGGEADATGTKKQIAVDEIHNVINVLEDIENDKLNDIEFVEALACPGGCVGGPLTVENNFVARSKIKQLCEEIPKCGLDICDIVELSWDKKPKRSTAMRLDDNIFKAMEMSNKMDEILDGLPHLDCGSCGSPSCRDLAEDIVRGFASESDCIFKIRERLGALAREMMEIESHAPRSSAVKTNSEEKR